MKRALFTFILLLLLLQAGATNFYFSTSDGDDSRSTTQAQSSSTPWKTLAKLRSTMSTATIVNGDNIFFKRGDVFNDSLGSPTKGLNFGAYGTGAWPVISGFYNIASWSLISTGIYESEALPTNNPSVNMVVINGAPYAMGRTPNADATNGGFLNVGSTGTLKFFDATSPFTSVYNGAYVVVRGNHYGMERSVITNISNDTISYTSSMQYAPTVGYGYFVENSPLTLDQFGEWYYNPTTKKLRVFFGSNSPASYTVQVAVKNVLLEPRANNTTIRDITFTGANSYCIWNNFGGISSLTIKNTTAMYAGMAGIAFTGRSGLWIDSCYIRYAHCLGIGLTFHNSKPLITNTTVRDIGVFPGMYIRDNNNIGGRVGNGICSLTQAWDGSYFGATVRDCTVQNTGYMGIFVSGDSNVVVHNFVDSTNTVLDDGGGIYHGNLEAYANTYERIDSNIVSHSVGCTYGTNTTIKFGEGLYFDDNSINVIATGNTSSYNSNSGMYLHNARKSVIRFNTLIGNAQKQLAAQDDAVGGFNIDTNIVAQNVFFATAKTQKLIYLAKDSNINNTFPHFFSKLDSNRYCAPFIRKTVGGAPVEDSIIQTNWFKHNAVLYYGVSAWRTFCNTITESTGYDSHTTITPSAVTDINSIIFKVAVKTPLNIRTCYTCLKPSGTALVSGETLGTFSSVILLRQ
jgi:hypothetical protein